jgi:recombination protein RecT
VTDTNIPAPTSPEPSPAPRALTPAQAFRGTLDNMEGKFAEMLPPHIPAKRFAGTIMTAVNLQPDLLATNKNSLIVACMKAAQDGLFPDGREAAFVIFRSKSGPQTQYMPMIGGLLKKLRNSGQLSSIHAEVVYEHDTFAHELGDSPKITHTPATGDRGAPIKVYAVAKTKDGAVYREVMSHYEVEQVRAVSRARDSGPWVQWWGEMAKKTVIRRLCKRLPSSADVDQVMRHDDETYDHNQTQQKQQAGKPTGPLSRLKGALGIVVDPQPPEQEAIVDVTIEEGGTDAGSATDSE